MPSPRSSVQIFLRELKRRRVYRVAVFYLIVGFVTLQVADMVFPGLLLPEWAFTLVVVLLILGFPVAVVLAWAFDITPEGVRRTEARDAEPGPVGPAEPGAGGMIGGATGAAPVTSDPAPRAAAGPVTGAAPETIAGAAAVPPRTGAGPGDPATATMAAGSDGSAQATGSEHDRSIAVLPFVNMSPELENDYFSDGMTEELINALTYVDGLKVAARTSAFAFKGRSEDVRTIGAMLGVKTVLEGSVRKSRNRLRVTAQLIDVANGYHLWSEAYDRELEDVFVIQEEIAQGIVSRLKVGFAGDHKAPILRRYTENIDAYNLYLKGRYCWNKRTGEGLQSSIEFFEQAAARDPSYALAHAGLADAYALLGIAEYGFMPPGEVMPKAKAAALKALEIDWRIVEAQTQVAHIKAFYEWDFAAAEVEFRNAMELDPQYAFAHHWLACLLAALGRHDEAVALEMRARELEPLSLIINKNVGTILYYAGRHDEALEEYRKALEMEPNFARTRMYLGLELAASSEYRQATIELEHALTLDPGNTVMQAVLGYAYGMAGEREKAGKVLRQLEARRRRAYVPAFNLALVHIGLDDSDSAFAWLDSAYEERSSWLISLDVEPIFRRLRPDPRFDGLLRRIGLRA